MNLNIFAKEITVREGLKKSVSIAQVKEIIKLVLTALSRLPIKKVEAVLGKYGKDAKK